MNKNDIKRAIAITGSIIAGKPLYAVANKVVPMRANWPQGPGLRFTARIVHDGSGRQIEELIILAGRIPPTATRFYWRGTLAIAIGDRTEIVNIPNPIAPEPWPICAKTLEKAFEMYDNLAKVIAKELETKLNAANEGANNVPSKSKNEDGQGVRNPPPPA
jgi:hypothetical protein